MRFYRLHNLIACVGQSEIPMLHAYETSAFPEAEANVCLVPRTSDSLPQNTFFRTGGAKRVGNRRWELFGSDHNIYFVFQDLLLCQASSFVHACALEWQGQGVLFWGPGGVGKTAIGLAALTQHGIRLLADDASALPLALAASR